MEPLCLISFAIATGALIISNATVVYLHACFTQMENAQAARQKVVELLSRENSQ
jgi:hypothetical protein